MIGSVRASTSGRIIRSVRSTSLLSRRPGALVRIAYESLRADFEAAGKIVPVNSKDTLRRNLDCLVLNRVRSLQLRRQPQAPIQTVKGVFTEGRPAYDGGGFPEKTHIQIAVCDATCIKGVFRVQEALVPPIGATRIKQRTARPNSNAPENVHEVFEKTVGRTVSAMELKDTRAKSKYVHNDETLTVEFTDGSRLVVRAGSNAGNLMDQILGFNASDLSLSYVPTFHEPRETRSKQA